MSARGKPPDKQRRLAWPKVPADVMFRRLPPDLPPIIAQLIRKSRYFSIFVWAMAGVGLLLSAARHFGVITIAGPLDGALTWSENHLSVLMLVWFALLWAIPITVGCRVRRFAALAVESKGSMCLHCAYRLRGLDDSGRCPECGQPFDRKKIERIWRRWAQPA